MDQSGTEARKSAGEQRDRHGKQRAEAARKHCCRDRTAEREASVNSQIRKIQNFVGNVNTECKHRKDTCLFDSGQNQIKIHDDFLFVN